ncbi:MAG: hypothetical protein ACREKL_07060 [Chthoniobacterales bacterium]
MKYFLILLAVVCVACSKKEEPAAATPNPTPSATPATPFAIPVPGKPGYVTSPYSSDGYIDVRGFPKGTEVKDPYSGKIFLVP